MSNRILVVSGESDIRKSVKMILTKSGYSVETADDGRDALLQLERSTYAGMLLEIHMPVMNGIQTLLLARRLYPSLPIVMMTGNPKKEILDRVLAGGAKEVLFYPIEPERLRQVAERWFPGSVSVYIRRLLWPYVHMASRFVSRVKNLWPMSFEASMGKTGTGVPPPQFAEQKAMVGGSAVLRSHTPKQMAHPMADLIDRLMQSDREHPPPSYIRTLPRDVALDVLVEVFERWYSRGRHHEYIDGEYLDFAGRLFAKAQVVEAPATALAWLSREDTADRHKIVGAFLSGFYEFASASDDEMATLLAAARCESDPENGTLLHALMWANTRVGNVEVDEFLKRQALFRGSDWLENADDFREKQVDKERPHLVRDARQFALAAHAAQRYGTLPYAEHLEQVAERAVGYRGDRVRAAAYLHDVLEDCPHVTVQDLEQRFGEEVARLVVALTKQAGETREEYFRRIRAAGPEAVYLKLADRLCNVRACLSEQRNDVLLEKYRREQPLLESILVTDELGTSFVWQELREEINIRRD